MSKINKKSQVRDTRMEKTTRLAGGRGQRAAAQDAESLLRRAVMACLLWENMAYESGASNASNIASLIPQVDPRTVADIAVEAREKQKLRHVPLFIAREMARHPEYNKHLEWVLPKIITRADMLSDFLALYWKGGKQAISNKVKKGLAAAFGNFEEYHFAKYDRDAPVKLRDVMFLVHPKPVDQAREALYKKIADRSFTPPDTWEVMLSRGDDKREAFEKLISERKLGGLAFLRNLRNMEQASVAPKIVREGFNRLPGANLLPLNFFAAHKHTTRYADEVDQAMIETYARRQKLPGHTVFVLDVSGSMGGKISGRSEFDRMQAGAAMAVLARECAEEVSIYLTAGSDMMRTHKTKRIKNLRGFALATSISNEIHSMGGGGIFTSQCIDFLKTDLKDEHVDRIIVFSDSQDCDRDNKTPAQPFGDYNYIVDVSAHKNGINYRGTWDAEISGWSEHFIDFIQAYEGLNLQEQNVDE
jgi:60 kDa SS-A/Ro ribonucleoprotein